MSYYYDKIKQTLRLETDRPYALREAIQSCRKGGTLSVPGVYALFLDKFPFGSAFAKGLNFKMGQTHVQKYLPTLLGHILEERIDPSAIISHRLPLDQAPEAYKNFKNKEDQFIKVVMTP